MKKRRQEKILSLIKEFEVETQDRLQQLLQESGFNVTQATVSRDINELGLVKGNSENGLNCYAVPEQKGSPKFEGIIRQAVVKLDSAGNIVVIKCHTGLANAACAALDSMEFPEVVGTISGDDTIFVLLHSEKESADFLKLINGMK